MKRTDEMNDMRIRILCHLRDRDSALEQIPINNYLAGLKTTNGNKDLGSIRRSLIDLEENEYIQQTHETSIINFQDDIKTRKTGWKDAGDPERFLATWNGDSPRIKDIYLGITLKGLNYLLSIDHEANIYRETKKSNNLVLVLIFATILTAGSGFIDNYFNKKSVECCQTNKKSLNPTNIESLQIVDSTNKSENNILIDSSDSILKKKGS